jgi:hypothetical protein
MVVLLVGNDLMVSQASILRPADPTVRRPGSVDCECLVLLNALGATKGQYELLCRGIYGVCARYSFQGRLNPFIYEQWPEDKKIAWHVCPWAVMQDAVNEGTQALATQLGISVRAQVVPIVATLYSIHAMLFTIERVRTGALTLTYLRSLAPSESDEEKIITEDAMYRLAKDRIANNAPLEWLWWQLNDYIIQQVGVHDDREFTFERVHVGAGTAACRLIQAIRDNPMALPAIWGATKSWITTPDKRYHNLVVEFLTTTMQLEIAAANSPALRTSVVLHRVTSNQSELSDILTHRAQFEFVSRTPLIPALGKYDDSPFYWCTHGDLNRARYGVMMRCNLTKEGTNPFVMIGAYPLIAMLVGDISTTGSTTRAYSPTPRRVVQWKNGQPDVQEVLQPTRRWQMGGPSGDQHWPINWKYGFIGNSPSDADAIIAELVNARDPGRVVWYGVQAPSWDVLKAWCRTLEAESQAPVEAQLRNQAALPELAHPESQSSNAPRNFARWINNALGVDLPFDE